MTTLNMLDKDKITAVEFVLKRKRNSKPIWLAVEVRSLGNDGGPGETVSFDARRPYHTEGDALKECKRLARDLKVDRYGVCRKYQGMPDRREEVSL